VLAAVLVGAVCWTPPVLDQIFNEPGNLGTLIDSASSGDRTLGWDSGWKAVVHTVGVPPWWLRDDPTPLERIGDLTVTPGAFAIATAAALLLLAAVLTAIGWRRRRPDLAAAGGLALLLPLAAGLAASSTPVKSFATVGYTLRWTSPVGMCVWLLAGWGAATLLAPRMRVPRAEPRIATVAVVALVAIAGVAVAIGENPPRREAYKPMRGLAHRLDEVIPASGGTRIVPASSAAGLGLTNELEAGSVFWLRRHGKPVVTTRNVADRVGSAYAKGSYERVLRLFVDVPPEPGGRVIARFPVVDEIDQKTIHTVTVTLAER
jgi:hypothetical protein